jgi:hypothetical protein
MESMKTYISASVMPRRQVVVGGWRRGWGVWWVGGKGEEEGGSVERERELKGAKRTIRMVMDAIANRRLRRMEVVRSRWRFGS